MSEGSRIERDAQDAYEAIRRINHNTIFGGDGIPAPVVYRALSFLQSAGGYGLAQALDQLGRGLQRSLATHDVYEDDGRNPTESVAHAVAAMNEAITLLERVGPLLDVAQAAIARQGYLPRALGGLDRWELVPEPPGQALRADRTATSTSQRPASDVPG